MARAPDPFPIFKRTGTPDNLNELDCNIETIADRLIAELQRIQNMPAKKNSRLLKPEDLCFLAYALIVHRTRRGEPLAEGHLRLVHAMLNINRTPLRAAEEIGLPPVKRLQEFIEAADQQARNPNIAVKELARIVGVDPKTIREWRARSEFDRLVRARRYLYGNPVPEDRKIMASWDAAVQKVNAEAPDDAVTVNLAPLAEGHKNDA